MSLLRSAACVPESYYFAIEGGVCCGKTTLANLVSSSTGSPRLPEYMEMVSPAHPAHSLALPDLDRVLFFFELDQRRSLSIGVQRNALVVGDRSILSIIAFEYAYSAVTGSRTFLPELVADQDLFCWIPDSVVVFDLRDSIRIARWISRGHPPDSIFINPEFNRAIHIALRRASKAVPMVFLEASDLSPPQMFRSTLSLLPAIQAGTARRRRPRLDALTASVFTHG